MSASCEIRPEHGLEVIVTGKITTYPAGSRYQIVIETMEAAGVGALLAQLERLKARLHAEGLFAPEPQAPLPSMPAVVGVITSPTGAVIRDILHRIRDRWPCQVLVWPCVVQGDAAAGQVSAAIRGFNAIAPGGPGTASRHPDRRPGRRLGRGPVGLQRRGPGPHGGRGDDPADLGRGPRDRHHPDRLRLRPPRPHPHRRRRDGHAGAGRPASPWSATSTAA